MSITQFISYSQVNFINELWKELGHQTQFFYDKGRDIYIFRNILQVFLINKQSLSKITRILIPHNGQITSMNSYGDQKYVVYQTAYNQINIFSSRLNKQSIFKLSKPEKQQSILHYEWLYHNKGFVDFIIVETSGVHLFKIEEDKHLLKEVKFFSQKISCCWFEPKNETLITTNYLLPGTMQSFFFNEKRKDFKCKGPEFCLDEFVQVSKSTLSNIFGSKIPNKGSSPEQNQNFAPTGDKKNLDLTQEDNSLEQNHRIYLVNLYFKSYLLYSNSSTGKIEFYYLTLDKVVKQKFLLTFPSDIMINLSIVDNLIVLSAVNEGFSMVFDIKKSKPETPLCPLQPIEYQIENQSVQLKAAQFQYQQNDFLGSIINKPSSETADTITKITGQEPMIEETKIHDEQQTDLEHFLKESEDDGDKFHQDHEEKIMSSTIIQAPLQTTASKNAIIQFDQEDDNDLGIENFVSQKREDLVATKDHSEVQFGYDFETFMQDLRESMKDNRPRDQYVIKMKWTIKPAINSVSQINNKPIYSLICKYQSLFEDNKFCNYLEDDLILDVKNRMLHQFQLNLYNLPKLLEDELEQFLAILRRSQCKQNVFEYLKDLVYSHIQIMTFSILYRQIFVIFSRAIQERSQKSEQQQFETQDKLKNGYTILYPLDFLLSFFQPLSDDTKVNRTYLVELLVEFMRQFVENLKDHRVQVPTQIQNLLIKILVKDNRMSYVHFLLQYQILSDSDEFAKLLIDIGSKETLESKKLLGKYHVYEPAFQMGIDMLHRLLRFDEMLDIFLRRGLVQHLLKHFQFQEAAYLLKKYSVGNKIRLSQVIEGHNYPLNTFTKQEVYNFFEDIYRKSKGEKLTFTPEELRTELYK